MFSSLAGHDADQGRTSGLLITAHQTIPQYCPLLPDQVDRSQRVLGYVVVAQLHILKWKIIINKSVVNILYPNPI
jgi:hypothetical protein